MARSLDLLLINDRLREPRRIEKATEKYARNVFSQTVHIERVQTSDKSLSSENIRQFVCLLRPV